MKPGSLLLLLFLLPLFLCAQDFYKEGSFVVRGKARNFHEPALDFGMTGFLGNTSGTLAVKKDGSFSQRVPIQQRQNVYFHLEDAAVTFSVMDGDTLDLGWDNTDVKKTFTIKGKNPVRTKELQLQYLLFKRFRESFGILDGVLNDNALLSGQKYSAVNTLYNQHLQVLLDSMGENLTPNIDYMITGLYFQFTALLSGLVPSYALTVSLDKNKTYHWGVFRDTVLVKKKSRVLNEEWFRNVPEYRDFINGYVTFHKAENATLFDVFVVMGGGENLPKEESIALRQYKFGREKVRLSAIRDWYLATRIRDAFRFYAFEEAEEVYNLFMKEGTSPYLKDTLRQLYAAAGRLRPGNPAPGFSLRDLGGKTVSLGDFKGKVVYIDFWGVGCAPCIQEIKNSVPGLHEAYKGKEVVFINICLDADGKELRDAIAKYKLGGINLATDWFESEVCKAYNVSSVPRYVLIDQKGRIVNSNAPGPFELQMGSGNNQIDKLLK